MFGSIKRLHPTRDSILFLGGLAMLYHETVVTEGERPFILAAAIAMLGLPPLIWQDQKRQEKEEARRKESDKL